MHQSLRAQTHSFPMDVREQAKRSILYWEAQRKALAEKGDHQNEEKAKLRITYLRKIAGM